MQWFINQSNFFFSNNCGNYAFTICTVNNKKTKKQWNNKNKIQKHLVNSYVAISSSKQTYFQSSTNGCNVQKWMKRPDSVGSDSPGTSNVDFTWVKVWMWSATILLRLFSEAEQVLFKTDLHTFPSGTFTYIPPRKKVLQRKVKRPLVYI